jgi:hypothetical protein
MSLALSLALLVYACPATLVKAQTTPTNCNVHSNTSSDTGYATVSARLGYESSTPPICTEFQVPRGTKFVVIHALQSRSGTQDARLTFKVYINNSPIWAPASNTPIGSTPLGGFFPAPPDICPSGCNERWKYFDTRESTAAGQVAMIVEYGAEGSETFQNAAEIQAAVWYRPAFALRRTMFDFVPRDARDTVSACSEPENENNCYPTYNAQIFPDNSGEEYFKGKIRYRLFNISSLRGNSTNNGSDGERDYDIESGRQQEGLYATPVRNQFDVSIETLDSVESAPLVVTSKDFGGTAQITAEINFPLDPDWGSIWISALVTEYGTGETEDIILDPTYARLPIDNNQNGIADAWEELHLGAGGRFPDRTADQEPGYDNSSPKGDGMSIHDEYRGMHHLVRTGSNVAIRHTRFDPIAKQDIFYVDRDKAFVGAVDRILAQQKKTGALAPIHIYLSIFPDPDHQFSGSRSLVLSIPIRGFPEADHRFCLGRSVFA